MREICRSRAYANANIALVKYWGKSDQKLNIPIVPSLSMTLANFGTTVEVQDAPEISVIRNGEECSFDIRDRVGSFLKEVEKFVPIYGPLTVLSESNIPFKSGLASSASFFAALAYALNHHWAWDLSGEELSKLARIGSASAARSLFSGYAGLYGGPHLDHHQAHGFSIKPHQNLDLAMILAIVNDAPKAVSSRDAMNLCQHSSPFFNTFVETHPKIFMTDWLH